MPHQFGIGLHEPPAVGKQLAGAEAVRLAEGVGADQRAVERKSEFAQRRGYEFQAEGFQQLAVRLGESDLEQRKRKRDDAQIVRELRDLVGDLVGDARREFHFLQDAELGVRLGGPAAR